MIRLREQSSSRPSPWLYVLLLALIVSLGFNFFGRPPRTPAGATKGASAQKWTCSMDPQVIQDHPGVCPICGMNLVPMRGSGGSVSSGNVIQIDPVIAQNIGMKTAAIMRRDLVRTLRTSGVAALDEGRVVSVSLRYMGWIEDLHVNKTGEYVREGEPLFEIFSPDLLNAQDAYIIAQHSSPDLVPSARARLMNLGMTDADIDALNDLSEAPQVTTVYSPASGFVQEKNVSEGSATMAGTSLMTIAASEPLWVLAQVFDDELPWIKEGSAATVRFDAVERPLSGRVSFIYPTQDRETRTTQVRVLLDKSEPLIRSEMSAQVYLAGDTLRNVLAIPRDAVIRSGERNVAFVAKDSGRVEPREVTLGMEADGYVYELTGGVSEGEQVVVGAAFLLDSESQLLEAVRKLGGGAEFPSMPGHQHADMSGRPHADAMIPSARAEEPPVVAENSDSAHLAIATGPTMDELFLQNSLYICPEHGEIVDDEKGTVCPLCRRALVALDSAEVRALRTATPYGCVMCPVVVPGSQRDQRCPICNMKLVAIENPQR